MENIKNFEIEDINTVMDIWLNSNIDSHSFIDKDYWLENYDEVKTLLPLSNLYIYKLDNKPIAFIGIMEDYIAGIFVDKKYRSMGIGKKLLDHAKKYYKELTLDVYEKNIKAYNFYLKNDFIEISRDLEDINNEFEVNMKWKR